MRTKTLILAAALGVAGALSASAQTSTNVYSVNAVGYVTVSLPSGFSMITNPLNTTNNNLSAILTNVPNFTTVYKWLPGTQSYDSSVFIAPNWLPDNTLNPGEGAFVALPSATNITFVGEVMQGSLTNAIPVGFSMKGSIVPQSGGLTTVLGFPAVFPDTAYFWDRVGQGWVSYTSLGGSSWIPAEPVPGVAEGFFMAKQVATNWVRTFSTSN